MDFVGVNDLWLWAYYNEGKIRKIKQILDSEQEEPSSRLIRQVIADGNPRMIAIFKDYLDLDDLKQILRRRIRIDPVTGFEIASRYDFVYDFLRMYASDAYTVLEEILGKEFISDEKIVQDIGLFLADNLDTIRLSSRFQPPLELLEMMEMFPEAFSFETLVRMIKVHARDIKENKNLVELAVNTEGFFSETNLHPELLAKIIRIGVLDKEPDLYQEAWQILWKTKPEIPSKSWYQVASELSLYSEPEKKDQNMALMIMASKETPSTSQLITIIDSDTGQLKIQSPVQCPQKITKKSQQDDHSLALRYFDQFYLKKSLNTLPLDQLKLGEPGMYETIKYLLSLI